MAEESDTISQIEILKSMAIIKSKLKEGWKQRSFQEKLIICAWLIYLEINVTILPFKYQVD